MKLKPQVVSTRFLRFTTGKLLNSLPTQSQTSVSKVKKRSEVALVEITSQFCNRFVNGTTMLLSAISRSDSEEYYAAKQSQRESL